MKNSDEIRETETKIITDLIKTWIRKEMLVAEMLKSLRNSRFDPLLVAYCFEQEGFYADSQEFSLNSSESKTSFTVVFVSKQPLPEDLRAEYFNALEEWGEAFFNNILTYFLDSFTEKTNSFVKEFSKKGIVWEIWPPSVNTSLN